LIPGLVAAAQKNADRGLADVALFEVGQIFCGDRPQDQLTAASGVRRALAKATGIGRHWSAPAAEVDAFEAKADALAVLAGAGAASRARRAAVVPSGTLRHDPDRPAERARALRRTASPRARNARCRGPAGRLRGDPGKNPGAEGEGNASAAGSGALRVSTGGARLRVRGRS